MDAQEQAKVMEKKAYKMQLILTSIDYKQKGKRKLAIHSAVNKTERKEDSTQAKAASGSMAEGQEEKKRKKKQKAIQSAANKTKRKGDSTQAEAATTAEGQDSDTHCEPPSGIEVTQEKDSQKLTTDQPEEVIKKKTYKRQLSLTSIDYKKKRKRKQKAIQSAVNKTKRKGDSTQAEAATTAEGQDSDTHCEPPSGIEVTQEKDSQKLTTDQPEEVIKKKTYKRQLDLTSIDYKKKRKRKQKAIQSAVNKTKRKGDSTQAEAATTAEGQDSDTHCEPPSGIEVTPDKDSQKLTTDQPEEIIKKKTYKRKLSLTSIDYKKKRKRKQKAIQSVANKTKRKGDSTQAKAATTAEGQDSDTHCEPPSGIEVTQEKDSQKLTTDQPEEVIKKKTYKKQLDLTSIDYKKKRKRKQKAIQSAANKTKRKGDSTQAEAATTAEGQDSDTHCEPPSGIEVTPDKDSQKLTTDQPEEKGLVYLPGQLVWGKRKGHGWWPGGIISAAESFRGRPPYDGHQWIKWFAEKKTSQIPVPCIKPFGGFNGTFVPSKTRRLYQRAVFLALEVAVERSQKTFSRADLHLDKEGEQLEGRSADDDELTDKERKSVVLDWAMNDFQPTGPQGFAPNADDVDSTQCLWAGDEGARFVKPMRPPKLDGDLKALFRKIEAKTCNIEEICLGCRKGKDVTKHPLFQGGLCKKCKINYLESSYLFDEDGSQMYCSICGFGMQVFMCDNTGCFRSYCGVCIDLLCGTGTAVKISSLDKWACHLCTGKRHRLLKRRKDWRERLRRMFINDNRIKFDPKPVYPPIAPEERRPIRVLALFDGIDTGLQALRELDIQVDAYFAAAIDDQAMQAKVATVQHQGDVLKINVPELRDLGPLDLVIGGGSPCDGLFSANPISSGMFEGTGRLFFEFFRLHMFSRPWDVFERPYFWLFQTPVGLRAIDKDVISRYLECNPVLVGAENMHQDMHRARFFWSNTPGMSSDLCRDLPQGLQGSAWSAAVIRRLLSPLKEYFRCEE